MVLSIGMIVKNEEKYLGQCLTALRPILENVDSELIIADTGSSDSTVEIAKGFTDNVYHFEWIDDFSAARNSTLEKAKGEWYMFIDADEILQNCDDIVRFFRSGEYRKYNAATYILRSYQNITNGKIDFSSYVDFRPLRLTKKYDEIIFEGIIHENLSPFYNPVKHLSLIADHYGYVFYEDGKTSDSAIEKSRRNLIPLFKTIDALSPGEKPDNSIYKKIADCYTISEEYDKALEYLDKGLTSVDKYNIGIIPYYSDKIYMLFYLKRYDEMLSLCDEYFSNENFARKTELATDILVHFFRGGAYYRLYRFNEAIEDFSAFFDLYKKYKNNELNTEDLLYSTLLLSDLRLKSTLLCFYDSCIKVRNYDIAAKYKMPFCISGLFDDRDEAIKYVQMKTVIMRNTDYGELSDLYSQLDSECQKQLLCDLRWELFNAETEIRKDILRNIETAVKNSPKEKAAVDICKNYFLNNTADSIKTDTYLKTYGTSYNSDILCILLDKNIDISAFVNAEDFLANECVHAVFSANEDFMRLLEKYNIGAVSEKGLEKTAELYKYAIALAASRKLNISELMKKYGAVGIKWRECFNDSGAPREIKSAEAVSRITSAFDQKDYRLCANEMNGFLASFPEFSPIIALYRSTVDRAEKEAQAAAPKALSEFEQMALAVKRNIRGMIRAGSAEDAENALNEYEALCPGDIEIKILREEISGLK